MSASLPRARCVGRTASSEGKLDPMHRHTYAISDPHGCLDVFGRALSAVDLSGDVHLYLLGDYVPHGRAGFGAIENGLTGDAWAARCVESLEFVRAYAEANSGKVTVLLGNHEWMLLDRVEDGEFELGSSLLGWLRVCGRTPYCENERQVLVHAGVDEEAGDWWRWGSDNRYFSEKFPPSFGTFEKDVIAGHVNAWETSHAAMGRGLGVEPCAEGVFWDHASHYYIDGTTERSGRINVLCYGAELNKYTQRIATADDVGEAVPVR